MALGGIFLPIISGLCGWLVSQQATSARTAMRRPESRGFIAPSSPTGAHPAAPRALVEIVLEPESIIASAAGEILVVKVHVSHHLPGNALVQYVAEVIGQDGTIVAGPDASEPVTLSPDKINQDFFEVEAPAAKGVFMLRVTAAALDENDNQGSGIVPLFILVENGELHGATLEDWYSSPL